MSGLGCEIVRARSPSRFLAAASAGASAEVADLKARLQTALQERDAARRKHQEVQDTLAGLTTQVSTLKAEASTLRETASGLEANIAEANAKLERAQAAAERYREKARSLEVELQSKF